MSHGNVDNFALVIKFLNDTWVPMLIIMGLFKVNKMSNQSMVAQLQYLLEKFALLHRVITFVKYQGINLASINFTFYHQL
jgi:hypothetical protein